MRFDAPPAQYQSLVMLKCSNPNCGAETHAACNCGVAYNPKEIAKQAIIADPAKSDRAIAKEIGSNPMTVGRARKELGVTGVTPERVGQDGKTYHVPDPKTLSAFEARKEKKDVAAIQAEYGWSCFENRVYDALEDLRNEIPDVFSDIQKISEVIKTALRRSIETEDEEATE